MRRRLPPLTLRQVRRLSPVLQAEHAAWVDRAPAAVDADDLRDQARRLAVTLLELGEDGEATERQLHRWRFHPALASEATAWALERHRVVASTGAGHRVEGDQPESKPDRPEVIGSTRPGPRP